MSLYPPGQAPTSSFEPVQFCFPPIEEDAGMEEDQVFKAGNGGKGPRLKKFMVVMEML